MSVELVNGVSKQNDATLNVKKGGREFFAPCRVCTSAWAWNRQVTERGCLAWALPQAGRHSCSITAGSRLLGSGHLGASGGSCVTPLLASSFQSYVCTRRAEVSVPKQHAVRIHSRHGDNALRLCHWRLLFGSRLRSVTQDSDHRHFLNVVARTDSVGNQMPAV